MTVRFKQALRVLLGRNRLPARRESETIVFTHNDFEWKATVSHFKDGKVGEVFLSCAKTGTTINNIVNDAAICASLAMQYGCPIETILSALSTDGRGEYVSALAVALNLFYKGKGRHR